MVDIENLADLYYEKLSDTTNPGQILARFFGELVGRQINKSHIIMMNKFVRTYDRFLVFFAILDIADVRELGENVYPLLSAICKRRFEQRHSDSTGVQYEKLDKYINNMEKQIEQMKKSPKKYKISSSEDLGKVTNGE